MKVTVRFFAMFREVFQAREKDVVMAEGATIAGLLESLCTSSKQRDELFENGALKPFLIILKNGRHIQHLEGLATAIENGDVISIFPAVAGG
jgi:molybdopterin synthase sulfur carrier subunit